MVSSTLSDPYVSAAFWAGIGALTLTALLSLQILRLRLRLRRRERYEKLIHDKWRPLLNAAIVGETPALECRLPQRELQPFLKLWLHLQFSVRGDAQEALNDIARRLHIQDKARLMLADGNRAEKLSAVLVLGYLRDISAKGQLHDLATSKDNLLSLNAVWAFLRVDPKTGLKKLMPSIVARDDWPLTRLVNILQEVGEDAHKALAEVIPNLPPEQLPHAFRLAESMRITVPPLLLVELLKKNSPTLQIAALRCVNTPELLPTVRSLLLHEDWRVRVQVAKALGRIGDREDLSGLVELLGDPEWWVRYRAAESLMGLPGLSVDDIKTLSNILRDRFAVEMLAQVMAEKGIV